METTILCELGILPDIISTMDGKRVAECINGIKKMFKDYIKKVSNGYRD